MAIFCYFIHIHILVHYYEPLKDNTQIGPRLSIARSKYSTQIHLMYSMSPTMEIRTGGVAVQKRSSGR